MLIFSYGSNMCLARLRERVPSADPVCVARLEGHELRFHKRSTDGSGKADAHATGNEGHVVWGVVYQIDPREKPKLDMAEGLGSGYDEKQASVVTGDGEMHEVQLYVATSVDDDLLPYHWYKRYVLENAIQHGLPSQCVEAIEAQPSQPDPKPQRAAKHRAVRC